MPEAANHPVLVSEEAIAKARPRIVPRTKATPIPTPSIFDEPTYCLKVNKAWASHFLGVILVLNNLDTWIADETHDVEWARNQVVEWVAKFLTEDMCMPCCDDLVEQLTTLITINQDMLTNITTIVTNLTTVINNQVTVIDQDNLAIYNQYLSEYNQYVSNNSTQQTWNNMFYDGTPQSIAPDAGDNFSEMGADSEKILCAAIEKFIANMIYVYGIQNMLVGGVAGAAATAFVAIGAALAVFSAGTSIVAGVAIAGLLLADNVLWTAIMNDPAAQRKARCCMFDNLKGQAITEGNFQHAFDDCGFDPGSHEDILTQQLSNSVIYYHDDYLGFLRFYQESNASGSTADCMCDCEDDITLEDYAGTGCVITPMGNCIYRFTQSTPTYIGSTPVRYFSFRDIMLQCLHVENSPDPTYPTTGVGLDSRIVNCDGSDYGPFVGGFTPGDYRGAHWQQADVAPVTYYKITLA